MCVYVCLWVCICVQHLDSNRNHLRPLRDMLSQLPPPARMSLARRPPRQKPAVFSGLFERRNTSATEPTELELKSVGRPLIYGSSHTQRLDRGLIMQHRLHFPSRRFWWLLGHSRCLGLRTVIATCRISKCLSLCNTCNLPWKKRDRCATAPKAREGANQPKHDHLRRRASASPSQMLRRARRQGSVPGCHKSGPVLPSVSPRPRT